MSDGHSDAFRWSRNRSGKRDLIKQKLDKTYIVMPDNIILPLKDVVLLYSESPPEHLNISTMRQSNKRFSKSLSELVCILMERGIF
jgi:hypothetical protein